MVKYLEILEELDNRHKYNKLAYIFPEEGELNRHMYPKQMEFYKAGSSFKERAVLGANRSGKSLMMHVEIAYHLTGQYPDWWEGKRFGEPVKFWCAGVSNDLVRDVSQVYLLGEYNDPGSGLIPRERIVEKRSKPGVPNAISEAVIKWGDRPGKFSTIGFKSYEQGRESFQGVALHGVGFDEEPPEDIYSEALTRTMTTGGIVISAFTPLKGMSELTLSFLPDGLFPKHNHIPGTSRYVMNLTWEEAPHLKEDEKKSLLATYKPFEIEARTKGMPSVGSGKIYPTLETDFVVEPFSISPSWPRLYGMDVGWKVTAAVFAAIDLNTDTMYIYDEYKGQEQYPEIHAAAIRARAQNWMYGAIDPASQQGNQKDGTKLLHEYQGLGLKLRLANNAVEAGITRVLNMLTVGKFKVFSSCTNTLQEYRMYHRNDKGDVVKRNDHFMDCMRYAAMTSYLATTRPEEDDDRLAKARRMIKDMSKDSITGY